MYFRQTEAFPSYRGKEDYYNYSFGDLCLLQLQAHCSSSSAEP